MFSPEAFGWFKVQSSSEPVLLSQPVLLHRSDERRRHQDRERGVQAAQLPRARGEDLWEAEEEGQPDLWAEIRWVSDGSGQNPSPPLLLTPCVLADKQLDLTSVDLKKLKVKDLKKILEDWGESCKGCAEKSDFIRKITELMPKYAPAAAKARTDLWAGGGRD